MVENILTPISLWSDFDLSLPLKKSVLNVVPVGSVDYNYVYFSGRQTETSRVRIYALYAKQKFNSKGCVLVLPDPSNEIDEELVLHFVKLGYDVLSVDYGGEREGQTNFTKYPQEISYANYSLNDKSFYYAEKTAKETCWYEWVAVARYAVNFLCENSPNKPISAIGIKNGANVLWQLAGVDKRINSAIFLFGAGWLAYKDVDKSSDTEIEMNDERIRFIAGVDAQSYAVHVTCPTLFIGTTNNKEFNAERSIDTLSYIENQKKVHYTFTPSSVDVLDYDYLNCVEIFLSKYLSKEKVALPEQPLLELSLNEDSLEYYFECDKPSNINEIILFTSLTDDKFNERIWIRNNVTVNEKGVGEFKKKLIFNCETAYSFIRVKYKNGFIVSSRFISKKITDNFDLKTPNVIFNAENFDMGFVSTAVSNSLIGDVFTNDSLFDTIEGPCGVLGLSSMSTLTTRAIKNIAPTLNDKSFIKFDVYSPNYINLSLVLNDGENDYTYNVSVTGGSVWQNVMAEICEFKDENGLPISNITEICSLSFKSIAKYTINNVMVL